MSYYMKKHNENIAEDMRKRVAERIITWNKMRYYNTRGNILSPIGWRDNNICLSDEQENELLEVATWWIIDDVYRYLRDCSMDMCVGAYIAFGMTIRGTQTAKENNAFNILLNQQLSFLGHTPVNYKIKSEERAHKWYQDTFGELLEKLIDDGYDLSIGGIPILKNNRAGAVVAPIEPLSIEETKYLFVERVISQKQSFLIQVRWLSDEEISFCEKLYDISQWDSYADGVPAEDII